MSKFHNIFSLVCRSILILLLVPTIGLAVGFGNLSINSNLGEKLHLEIDLLSVTPTEIGTMTVDLASRTDYARADVPYPSIAEFLNFEMIEGDDGKFRVTITSVVPITESFLHLLISANWSGGKVIREYTALLDPPLYSGESAAVVEVADSDEGSEQENSTEIAATTGSVGTSQEITPVSTLTTGSSTVTVMRGDTLSGIVNSLNRPASVSLVQGLTAILEANPDAFIDGNMNRLIAGASLNIPDFNSMAEVNPQSAIQNFRTQVAEYNQYLTGIGYAAIHSGGDASSTESISAATDSGAGQSTGSTAAEDADSEGVAEETGLPEIDLTAVEISLDTGQQPEPEEDVRLSIGQESSDEDIARAISGSEGDAAQVDALKVQLAELDESLLASGVENEEVKQRIKDIQAQVDRVSKLLEIENDTLAMSQDRAASESDPVSVSENDSEEAVAAIAKVEQPGESSESKAVDAGTDSESSQAGDSQSGVEVTGSEQVDSAGSAETEEIIVAEVDTAASGSQPEATTAVPAASTATGLEEPEPEAEKEVAAKPVSAATKEKLKASAAQLESTQSNTPERQVVQNSIMDNISGIFGSMSDYALKIVAGLVVLIAGLFFYRRKKSKQEFEESMLDIESGQISANSAERSFSQLSSTSGVDLASGGDSGLELTIGSGMSYLSEEGIAGVAEEDNEVVQTGAVDPMAEADVYLAYDRDEQAIQVLKEAYSTNPERHELAEKLLEVYHKQDDRIAFDGLAAEFRARLGSKKSPIWTKVATMGKEVSPDNELYDEYAEFESLSAELDSEATQSDTEIPAAEDIKMLNLEDDELDIGRQDDTAIKSLDMDDLELPEMEKADPDVDIDTPTLSQIITAAEEEEMRAKLMKDQQQEEQAADDDEIEEIKFDLGDDELAMDDELDLDDSDTTELAATLARLDVKDSKSVEVEEEDDSENVQEDSYLSEASEKAMSNMEPYHESETALELAKAYLELGEKDIAKGFIEEVINEGSDKQKAKAEKLVKELLD